MNETPPQRSRGAERGNLYCGLGNRATDRALNRDQAVAYALSEDEENADYA